MRRAIIYGPLAGLAGTAVMTLAQHLEMSVTGRPPSTVPGQVAARLLSRSESGAVADLNIPMHWAHGAAMGCLRGSLTELGRRGFAGSAAFFALMWTGDAMLYKTLGIADWPWRWTPAELALDIGHKALYTLATSATYEAIARSD